MKYNFSVNLYSKNNEIHIYEVGKHISLCNQRFIRGEAVKLINLKDFLGNSDELKEFDEYDARIFSALLQNQGYNVCGVCMSKMYLTK